VLCDPLTVLISLKVFAMNKSTFAAAACIAVSSISMPAKAHPADAKAVVPQATYKSPFADYKRLGEDKPQSWRDANDTVTRIGGWKAYLREAQEAPVAPTPSAPRRP
jgi:hypothetical protein